MSRSTKGAYALKVFPYKHGKIDSSFLNEQRFASLQHPNIISMGNSKPHCVLSEREKCSYLLMEYSPFGDFFELANRFHVKFTNKLLLTYFHQMVDALEYLHSNKIAHLDLKPDNLLLMEDFQLKLIDFDLAYREGDSKILSKGTQYFRAPEISAKSCKDPKPADIFSLGIIIFFLKAGGQYPQIEDNSYNSHKGENLFGLLQDDNEKFWDIHINRLDSSRKIFTEDFREMFNAMTRKNPTERPTIQEIKNFKWYQGEIYSVEELQETMKELLFF
jgi:serine/threonine protein kinase